MNNEPKNKRQRRVILPTFSILSQELANGTFTAVIGSISSRSKSTREKAEIEAIRLYFSRIRHDTLLEPRFSQVIHAPTQTEKADS